MKLYNTLHGIGDRYPIYSTVTKTGIKRDVNLKIFKDTSDVDTITL